MALRRKLPSRMTPDSAPEPAVTASNQPENTAQKTDSRPPRTPQSAASAVKETAPQPAVSTTPAPSQTGALAAAAASAFGTVGTARVLEDSFAPAPAWQPEEQPAAPAFTAPAWEAPAAPAIAAAPMPQAATEPQSAVTPAAEEFTAPAWEAPAMQSEPQPQPAPEITAEPAAEPISPFAEASPFVATPEPVFTAPAWEEPVPQPELQPEPLPEPVVLPPEEPQAIPAAQQVTDFMPQDDASSASFQPSRPDGNSRRRVREKRPRDFTAMGSPENQQPERPKPTTAFAANVPVNTKSLDKVDEDLIATGIIAPPPADSLTGSLPTGSAESESRFTPPPYEAPAPVFTPAPAPQPAAASVSQPETRPEPRPEPTPAPQLETLPAPQPEPVIIPVNLPDPMPATQPEFKPEPQPEPTPAYVPPAPQPEAPRPSFNLSSQARTEPLPPPQSDLPWTQPQASAEWEIETPQSEGWHMDAAPATPSHMPPPGDLYGAMNSAPAAPVPPFAAPPRPSAGFTPEIPAQRRRQAGTPWALVAVAGLVVVGAGAWYMRSGGSQQAQQQLAQLTSGARQDANPVAEGLLPPPTDSASFYTPPAASDVSSAAIVNFADVPPELANQPIVSDGTEQVPDDLSLADRMKMEINKARAEKQGAQLAEVSGTAAQPTAAAASAVLERQKLNEELAAYRSALAQSGNPSELTPANFRRDPDGYMDGKPQAAAETPLASGQLLPPPSGAEGGAAVLPPPELYTNNPSNLPVVAEPVAGVPQRVRTLADFPDVEPYMPEREKVAIPKNLKPKMAATDFPSLEVLSFVPGKGIVAFADGREGVLLIGESINGWELVAVAPDNAEFKTGQRSHQVTAEN